MSYISIMKEVLKGLRNIKIFSLFNSLFGNLFLAIYGTDKLKQLQGC